MYRFTCLLRFHSETVNKVSRHTPKLTYLLSNKLNKSYYSTSNDNNYDVAIVGGGIIGLATARELSRRYPQLKYVLLEKEKELSTHQSGHNSGVIHAGIYYAPGSLKAKLCVEGLKLVYEYADAKNIPYKKCGKLIVAVEKHELPKLDGLLERATINKVPGIRLISGDEIQQIEPACRGLKAIHSPETGIIDWRRVALSYGDDFKALGGVVYVGFEADKFSEGTDVKYSITIERMPQAIEGNIPNKVNARYVITCAGLHADVIAQKTGCPVEPKIVPFRGDYLLMKPEKASMIKGNIYPIPDPRFPFLGVHFTPRMDGSVWLGPNAILSFKREGYGVFDFSIKDSFDSLSYPGLRKIAFKFLRVGLNEFVNNVYITRQVNLLKRFVPELTRADVERGPSGVRAQALGLDGSLVDDFVFHSGEGPIGKHMLHVRNAPSPAATSSLAIACMISDKAETEFDLSRK